MTTRMEPSGVKYEFVEAVERLDYYAPRGYHPVTIGDELCAGRYVIAHKLGFGRSATTWLAEDRRAKSELPGKVIVQNLLDSFKLSGPNGIHRCLVTDAARINIHEAKDAAYH
ncbi:hypothetical protein AJ80_06543 [Polytolypa hystricis UAMH7299]|uniref:non-specific serine/threonine protein kinase n=1 Tax=Polytolypa hystricis (strain UAMH7299) TaxID=1447883 RepID=A0A2B7XWK5_POLH7|nr:hypothetical protein AJ80_06543 [Polytolypa hystricis UAMH7299]